MKSSIKMGQFVFAAFTLFLVSCATQGAYGPSQQQQTYGAYPPASGELTCADVLQNSHAMSDDSVIQCATANQLGNCSLQDARGGGGACEFYVRLNDRCSGGQCGAPLSGTGCTRGYYAQPRDGFPWNCNQPTGYGAAVCMLRLLLDNGLCGQSN